MRTLAGATIACLLLTGCSTYRVTSNIPPAQHATPASTPVAVIEGEPVAHRFEELGPIEVTVHKGSPVAATPTRKQADSALVQKARDMGADAVIRVQYESGFNVFSWGYISAAGVGVRFID